MEAARWAKAATSWAGTFFLAAARSILAAKSAVVMFMVVPFLGGGGSVPPAVLSTTVPHNRGGGGPEAQKAGAPRPYQNGPAELHGSPARSQGPAGPPREPPRDLPFPSGAAPLP